MNNKIKLLVTLLAFAAVLMVPACVPVFRVVGPSDRPTPEVSVGYPGVGSDATQVVLPGYPGDVQITPTPEPTSESLVVTLNDKDKIITLKVGQRFLLKLGETYDWTVIPDDPTILSRVPNVMVVRGAQGLYEAHKAGQTVLAAQGDPACLKSTPPCKAPSILVRFKIVVEP